MSLCVCINTGSRPDVDHAGSHICMVTRSQDKKTSRALWVVEWCFDEITHIYRQKASGTPTQEKVHKQARLHEWIVSTW